MVWAAKRVGPAGEMDRRPHRGVPHRLQRARCRDQGAARVRQARPHRWRWTLELTANTGAHTVSYVPLSNGYRVAPTVYDIPLAYVRLRAVMTNTVPTAPFRGAGRPEATAVMERLIDIAARRLKIDRVELRRRNLIAHEKLPHRTPTGLTYDSGDVRREPHARARRRRLAGIRRSAAPKRRSAAACAASASPTTSRRRSACRTSASRSPSRPSAVDLIVGTQSSGQGHETSFRQVMADQLGVDAGRDQLRERRQRDARVRRRHALGPLDAARRLADGRDLADHRRQGAPRRARSCSTSPRTTSRSPMDCSPRRTAIGG